MSVLQADNVTRVLEGTVPVTLVKDVDVAFEAGGFYAITGPSGSGKSSLLYLLGLLDVPTEGAVSIEGAPTAERSADDLAAVRLEKLGFIFQFHFLLEELTVMENIVLPMRKLGKLDRDGMLERAGALLDELGLGGQGRKHPYQLSGGERQRAAVARALANDPLIILADEPTGNLDSHNAATVFDIFERLANREGRTVIAVTHDQDLASRAEHQVRMLDGRIA